MEGVTMKLIEVKASSAANDLPIKEEIYRMRARIFGQRLGWRVSVDAGKERDEFDDYDPTYLAVLDPEGTVCAAVRLLPAVGPTMLQLAFPQLLAEPPLKAAWDGP
jgi:acyl homoserine lactone synthase